MLFALILSISVKSVHYQIDYGNIFTSNITNLFKSPVWKAIKILNFPCVMLTLCTAVVCDCNLVSSVSAWVRMPVQSSKMKHEKYFFGDCLSADFCQKL